MLTQMEEEYHNGVGGRGNEVIELRQVKSRNAYFIITE